MNRYGGDRDGQEQNCIRQLFTHSSLLNTLSEGMRGAEEE
jgi:hypothetical protein